MSLTPDGYPIGRKDGSTSSSLLRQLKSEDTDGWERFVERYTPMLYGWCRRSGLSSEDAADVLQDVFHSVATGIERFERIRGTGSFRAWLRTVARSRIQNHYRRNDGKPQARGGSGMHRLVNVADHRSDVDGSSSAGRKISQLEQALKSARNECGEQTWTAFELVTFHHFTSEEAASHLGISPAAVRMAKYRILKRLREILSVPGNEAGGESTG